MRTANHALQPHLDPRDICTLRREGLKLAGELGAFVLRVDAALYAGSDNYGPTPNTWAALDLAIDAVPEMKLAAAKLAMVAAHRDDLQDVSACWSEEAEAVARQNLWSPSPEVEPRKIALPAFTKARAGSLANDACEASEGLSHKVTPWHFDPAGTAARWGDLGL